MITVVLISLNEAEKLINCLPTVKDFAQEIIIIDLNSIDNTKEIARQYNAKVFSHEAVPYVELIRNFAISKSSNQWVLVLDPDERLPQALATKLTSIAKSNRYSAVSLPRKNIFFGHWIAHTNFWPDYQIRFFKKQAVYWPGRIHTVKLKIDGEVLELEADPELALQHYGYDNFGQFIMRQIRYAKIDAQNRFSLGERFSIKNLFWLPCREFLARFIKHQGYLDGFYGLFLVLVLMYYQIMVQINLIDLNNK